MTPQTLASNIRQQQLLGGCHFDLPRQTETEGRSSGAVFHPGPPSVLLDDASRDRQAKPQPSGALPGRCDAGPAVVLHQYGNREHPRMIANAQKTPTRPVHR